MLVNANDNRVKYQDQLSDVGLAGLRSDQKADRFTAITKQMFEDMKSIYQPLPSDGTAAPEGGKSTGKAVAGFSVTDAQPQDGATPTGYVAPPGPSAGRAANTAANTANTAYQTANPGTINPNAGSASGWIGAIEKAQYEDKKARFDPIENALMQETTYMNPNLAGREIGKAEADTMQTYDNISGSQAIQLGRYGMSLNSDQQTSSDRLNSLGRTGAVIDAANNIRLKLVERNQQIAAGTATNNLASTK